MKYRVHIECRNAHLTECIAYTVQGKDVKEAKAKASCMAVQHYPAFDKFEVYHVEELRR